MGIVPARYQHYPTHETADGVARLVGVVHEDWMQDFPFEVADPARVEEFLDHYTTLTSDDERRVLIDLVVASLEECSDRPAHALATMESILVASPEVHAATIIYWSSLCDDGAKLRYEPIDEAFDIAEWMRRVLSVVAARIGFHELPSEDDRA
jgi:hypothetical protein